MKHTMMGCAEVSNTLKQNRWLATLERVEAMDCKLSRRCEAVRGMRSSDLRFSTFFRSVESVGHRRSDIPVLAWSSLPKKTRRDNLESHDYLPVPEHQTYSTTGRFLSKASIRKSLLPSPSSQLHQPPWRNSSSNHLLSNHTAHPLHKTSNSTLPPIHRTQYRATQLHHKHHTAMALHKDRLDMALQAEEDSTLDLVHLRE